MDLYDLTRRLDLFPRGRIECLDADGRVEVTTYPELARDVRPLSARLKASGLKPGHRVGILASNCLEFILWDLALLEIRCTVVAFPSEMGRDFGIRLFDLYGLSLLLISRREHWAEFSEHPHTAWLEDRAANGLYLRTNVPVFEDTADVHALTFSSGSSGVLKCYRINRRGGEWDAEQFQRIYDLGPRDRLLIFLPLSSYQQRLLSYCSIWFGISIILCGPEQALDGLSRLRPTLCLAPPLLYEGIHTRYLAAFEAMGWPSKYVIQRLRAVARGLPAPVSRILRRFLFRRVHRSLGNRIRVMWTGMAPIRYATLEFFEEACVPLFEAYGISEGGVIAANVPSSKRSGSVGRPLEGCEVVLADDGEILLRRKEFATFGYYGADPSWTPIFREEGVLATGDIGRFDHDGFLYLIGRKKEIIVTSQGQKVHPERIEALINESPVVLHSVAFGDGLAHLVVVVSLRKPRNAGVEAELAATVEAANRRLAPNVRIARTILTDVTFTAENGLLTRNLKLDRRAIHRRFCLEVYAAVPRHTEAPRHVSEIPDRPLLELVSSACKEVLGLSEISVHANFLDLGGDSLCAMRVVNQLHPEVPQVSVRDVLEAGTIFDLAVRIVKYRQEAGEMGDPGAQEEEGVI